jgi:hypothetical protein
MYYVIITRYCANMQQELATALQGRKDIQVILDRRYGERRADLDPTSPDRRHTDRRRTPGLPLVDSGTQRIPRTGKRVRQR